MFYLILYFLLCIYFTLHICEQKNWPCKKYCNDNILLGLCLFAALFCDFVVQKSPFVGRSTYFFTSNNIIKLNIKEAFCKNIPVLVKNMFYKTTKSVRWSRRTKRYKCFGRASSTSFFLLFQCYWYPYFLRTNNYYNIKCHK